MSGESENWERIEAMFKRAVEEPKERLGLLMKLSEILPMGSMYCEVKPMLDLLKKVDLFCLVTTLEPLIDGLNLIEIGYLSVIINKIILSSNDLSSISTTTNVREYYKFCLKLADRTDLSDVVSNTIFARGVYFMTCVDKELGASRLYEIMVDEQKKGRLFNAGHAGLDWLFCIDQSRVFQGTEVSVCVRIMAEIADHATKLREADITVNYCKGLMWFISNFKYFFLSKVESNPAWVTQMQEINVLSSRTLAGFVRLMYVGTKRCEEAGDFSYKGKILEMSKNAMSFLFSTFYCPTAEEILEMFDAIFEHLMGIEREPIYANVTPANMYDTISENSTLHGWLESMQSHCAKIRMLSDSARSSLEAGETDVPLARQLVRLAFLCKHYMTQYSVIADSISLNSKEARYLRDVYY